MPYYWNIAPEYDATITPVYMTKRGTQLKNQTRYLNEDFTGELKLEYLPDDKEFGGTRDGVSWQHAQTSRRPGPAPAPNIDYNRVSDDRYFVDLASQVRQVTHRQPAAGRLPHLQLQLRRRAVSARRRACSSFQTLQDPLAPIVPPYHRLPQLNFSGSYGDLGGFLDAALPAEYVRFQHPTLVEGARATLSSDASPRRCSRRAGSSRPRSDLRYVDYHLNGNLAAGAGRLAERHHPLGQRSTAGLVFERDRSACSARAARRRSSRACSTCTCRTATRTRSRSSTPRSPTSTTRSSSARTASSAATASATRTR